MKILYLCPDLGIPVLGRKGAAVHVRELVAAFGRAGHSVVLAAQMLNKSPDDKAAKVRARVIHVQPDPVVTSAAQWLRDFNEQLGLENSSPGELRRILYNRAFYRDLKRRFLKHKPDFIYERASLYASAGVRLAEKFKVPHIVELNAPLAVEQTAYRATAFGGLAARAERWMLTHADAVVVVSSELRRHVLALGVKPVKIHVMSNGVDPELFYPANGGARHSVRAGDAKMKDGAHGVTRPTLGTLGFVGGLRPWHGVEILPELLKRLRACHRNVRLVIAGDGPLRGELKRGFEKRGLTRNVVFTGLLSHEEMPAVIRQFDVALAPYPRAAHGFYFSPLKLFEYMACGVPVVAAKLGQIAEVVRHGKTGLLYPPGSLDALTAQCEKLLTNAKLRATLGQAASKLVHRQFTWDKNAERVAGLARSLITSRRKYRRP